MNRYFCSELDLRQRVEKELKKRIPEPVWQFFVEDRTVAQARQDPEDFGYLVSRIEKFLSVVAELSGKAGLMLSPVETPRRQRRNKLLPARSDADSEFVAQQARDDEQVQAFRKRYFIRGLLSPSDAAAWIEKQTFQDTHAVVVRIPGDAISKLRHGLDLSSELSSVKREQIENLLPLDFIAYQRPGSPCVHRKPIGRGGALRELWLLSRELAEALGWTEDQATMFVLTDLTPAIATARWEISPVAPLFCLTRINLTIGLQITPEELAKNYRTIRSKLLRPKHRSLGEKHCRLAVFALKNQDLNQAALREWNNQYPKWSYSKVNRFAKEARQAKQRQEERLERLAFDPAKLPSVFLNL